MRDSQYRKNQFGNTYRKKFSFNNDSTSDLMTPRFLHTFIFENNVIRSSCALSKYFNTDTVDRENILIRELWVFRMLALIEIDDYTVKVSGDISWTREISKEDTLYTGSNKKRILLTCIYQTVSWCSRVLNLGAIGQRLSGRVTRALSDSIGVRS